jgi:hypothetical protein
MSFLSKAGMVIIIVVVVCATMWAIEKRSLYADPNVAPQFERAKADAAPLIAALAEYYASHAYYPKSLGDLPPANTDPRGFIYEVWGMQRVYNSLECAGRSRQFTGFVGASADYERRLAEFRAGCVRGYSSFMLKSPRISTAWQINKGVVAYAEFHSQDAEWSVQWCRDQHPGTRDCRITVFNESAAR